MELRLPREASGPIAFVGGEANLVRAVRERQPAAIAAFYDRYAARVRRILGRILGSDQELSDIHHDTFEKALLSIDNLRDPSRLTAWITSVAVLTAWAHLQRKSRRRWLVFAPPEDMEAVPDHAGADAEKSEAVRATYRVLDRMPPEERVVFTLRFIEGMILDEVAEASGVSLATAKRRLAKAGKRFAALAQAEPALVPWLSEGARWNES
ncbi:MAG TPA: sigma-70 family RNA polymerase sigma factor [Polyangiaceae bacterium]|nr:sigma-70 family RNA polymerase sigma factor [Polyangiaceae bacterium]